MATQNLKCTSSPGAEKHGVANSLAFLSDSPNASSPANRTNTIFKDKCQTVGNSSDVPQDIGINDSMRPPPPTPPRYQKWTIEEEEALCAGVEKHGIGNWVAILSDPQFASTLVNRSNIKLKDKWRTLSTSSEMSDNKQRVRARRIKESMHSPTPLPPTPRYQKWTAEEEEAFCAGVEKHGIRNWQAIRSDPKFASTLVNRSNINLKDKWRTLSRSSDVSNNKRKVTACRIDDLMHPRQHSTKKISGKREVEEVSNSQDCPVKEVSDPHDFPVKEVNDPQDCPVDGVSDPQDCPVDEVSDPQDFPVEEVSDPQDFLVEEVSDSEDCPADEISDSHGCPVDEVSDSQYCPVDEGSESDVYLIEELSNSQDHHSSCC